MMQFLSYPRIRESLSDFRAVDLLEGHTRRLEAVEWIATEKIHGANFCVLFDRSHVECARRRGPISAEEHFFGYRDTLAPLLSSFPALFEAVSASLSLEITHCALFGELHGGGYAHPEVASVEGVERVQTGVDYAPGIHFCAFDLAIWSHASGSSPSEEPVQRFLDFDQAQALVCAHGIDWNPALHRGRLGELLDLDPDFPSTIATSLHGLPPLPGDENLAEGFVIRPAIELDDLPMRPLIKLKSPRFAEDARYHQATNWSAAWDHRAPGKSALDVLEWEALQRLNPPRLQAALSKVGRPGDGPGGRLFAELLEELTMDVMRDLREGHPHQMLAIDAEEAAFLMEVVRDAARELAIAGLNRAETTPR